MFSDADQIVAVMKSRNPTGDPNGPPYAWEVFASVGLYLVYLGTLAVLVYGAKPFYVAFAFIVSGAAFWWLRDVVHLRVIAAFQILVGASGGTYSVLIGAVGTPGDWVALIAGGIAIADGFEKLFRTEAEQAVNSP
jgi:hypothetical protein